MILCAVAASAKAQTISLVTAGPGTAPNTWFGHSALLVEDDTGARLYSYGVIQKSLKSVVDAAFARVTAHAVVDPADAAFARLRNAGRTVLVQKLSLEPAAARRLALRLDIDARLPVTFTYDALEDNCSTRLRDAIAAVVGASLRQQLGAGAPLTIRDVARDAARDHHVIRSVADVMIGHNADRAVSYWELAAVPSGLAAALSRAGLAESASAILSPEPESLWAPFLFGALSACMLAFLGLRVRRAPQRARRVAGLASIVIGVALGVPGLVLAWARLIEAHTTLAANANIVFANPLALLAVPLGALCAAGRARCATSLRNLWATIALMAVVAAAAPHGPHPQDNVWFVALVVPVLCGAAVLHVLAVPVVRRAHAVRGVFPHPLSEME